MADKQRKKVVGQAARLERLVKQSFIAIGIGMVLLVLSLCSNYMMSLAQSEQLTVTMALNQYKDASRKLTSEVQSYAVTGNQIYYDNYMQELNTDKNREQAITILKEKDITEEEWSQFDKIAALSDGLVPLEEEAMNFVIKGDLKSAQEMVFGDEYEATSIQITTCTEAVIEKIQQRKAEQKTMFQTIQLIAQFSFFAACVYIIYLLIKTIKFAKKELLHPIEKVAEQMNYLAHGDFDKTLQLKEDESEVGHMVSSIGYMKENMHGMISEISSILGFMGNGNYQFEIKQEYVGEFSQIKESIIKIGEAMRETLHTMRDVAEQIDAGSEQLSCAAQDLAGGSTIQATQVAEVAETIKKMTESMVNNANATKESVKIASDAGETLITGNKNMQELKTAIGEISKCSEEIGSIISAIEDIARETNLLSLNAAIEAARAGEAGRGFSVVAEQVKNLAEESSKAAGKTTELIQMTIDAVNKGIDIADVTAKNMTLVMDGAVEATEKMGQVANILEEEADQMQQINETMATVSEVVDNNSATSEETAAVSEEQKAQVETMVQMVGRFQI